MYDLSKPWPAMLDRTRWLLVTLGFVALLFALYWVDVPLSVWGQASLEPVRALFLFLTELGEAAWVLVPSLVLLVLSVLLARAARAWTTKRALRQMAGLWAFVFVGVGLPGLVINLIKRVIGRARPHLLEQPDAPAFQWIINDWTHQSFPSGHTTTAFAFCFVVSFLWQRSFPWMLALAVLIALSRVIVGAHYPTDVLGGAVLGVFGAYLVRNFFATRGWVFRIQSDGRVVRRDFAALRRLLRGTAVRRRRGSG